MLDVIFYRFIENDATAVIPLKYPNLIPLRYINQIYVKNIVIYRCIFCFLVERRAIVLNHLLQHKKNNITIHRDYQRC